MKVTVVMTCLVVTLVIALMIGSSDAKKYRSRHLSCNSTVVSDKEHCKLRPETGMCRARFIRWHYDSTTNDCKTFTYGGCGANGNNFVTKWKCLQNCTDKRVPTDPGIHNHTCSKVTCRMYCPGGFILDRNGCETCSCKPPPQTNTDNVAAHGISNETCSPRQCMMFCVHGFIKDRRGCNTCSCNPDPSTVNCPQIECPERCSTGYQTEKNGCMTCRCKVLAPVRFRTGKCGTTQCFNECPMGRKMDASGCEGCECKDAEDETTITCRQKVCSRLCSFGFQTDEFGCPLCACKNRKSQRPSKGHQHGAPSQLPVLPDSELPA